MKPNANRVDRAAGKGLDITRHQRQEQLQASVKVKNAKEAAKGSTKP